MAGVVAAISNKIGGRRLVYSADENMIAELKRRQRAWQAKIHRRRDKIRRALANGVDGAAVLEMVTDYSSMISSELRLPRLLDVLDDAPPDVFWKVIEAEWAVCDDTWSYTERLLHMMRHCQAHAPTLTPGGQDTELAVFRGCSLSRVRGISWTLDRQTAERFARGHRGIPVPDLVVASALVPISAVFMFIDGREEAEVLLDPTLLTNVEINNAQG